MDDRYLSILKSIASAGQNAGGGMAQRGAEFGQNLGGMAQRGMSAAIPGGNMATTGLQKLIEYIRTMEAGRGVPTQTQEPTALHPELSDIEMLKELVAGKEIQPLRKIQLQYQTSEF